MQKRLDTIVYSATDLVNHMGCSHATELDRLVTEGALKPEYRYDPTQELLKELGRKHENDYLLALKEAGKKIVQLRDFEGPAGVDKTIEAMRRGVDVVSQAQLESLPWAGRADFLLKVNRPSSLGSWSYQVADAKLSQTTKPGAVLQLCLYSDLVSDVQGIDPELMLVVKPGREFEIDTLRVTDFVAFYRMAKARFEGQIASGPKKAYPDPVQHCDACRWWPRCTQTWRDDDHLSFVAGIRKGQIAELVENRITTLEDWASRERPLPRPPRSGSMESLERAHRQAKVQLAGRQSGSPRYEFNEPVPGRGFYRLPLPNEGDIFFDIEGNPRAIGAGVEYLFGYSVFASKELEYTAAWAFDAEAERRTFEVFIDFTMSQWNRYPGLHVYHFAPYEPAALKRLALRYSTREQELDRLLRGERFIDLHSVVKQGIVASVEKYSLKDLERFFRYTRRVALEDARKSLPRLERLLELNQISELAYSDRETVEGYNRDDCNSTFYLREWLEGLRSELEQGTGPISRPEMKEGSASEAAEEMDTSVRRVFDQLVSETAQRTTNEERARRLLADLLDYFRREAKCQWWEYFRLRDLDIEDFLTERPALGSLSFVESLPLRKKERVPIHRYRFPAQETTIATGDSLHTTEGVALGVVKSINIDTGTIDVKKTGRTVNLNPTEVFAFDMVGPGSMPESLLAFGQFVAESASESEIGNCARYDILARRQPRLQSLSLPLNMEEEDAALRLALDLDDSILPIQGPPGTGKTYIGARMIIDLARRGKRIGVTAVSHAVILNLLESVSELSDEAVVVAHKGSDADLYDVVEGLSSSDDVLGAIDEGIVTGGTAWLWSTPTLEQELDYLFIDEAGQMSLAMAIAAGRAARNIVLLGDPQQLEQPQQGMHPEGAGVAVLTHILDGRATLRPDMGLFLERTRRLHPKICQFTSEQYYENRLRNIDGLENQEILGPSDFRGSGLRFFPVEHSGNQNRSIEEVQAVRGLYDSLLDGRHLWRDKDKSEQALSADDILVVAPYNAQVAALREVLPSGARVGTVDRFQGQQAPIVIYSLTSSSADDVPRGMSFLFSQNRLNVATSRAQCLVILVGAPALFEPDCATTDQMRLANGFCRYLELAEPISTSIAG